MDISDGNLGDVILNGYTGQGVLFLAFNTRNLLITCVLSYQISTYMQNNLQPFKNVYCLISMALD